MSTIPTPHNITTSLPAVTVPLHVLYHGYLTRLLSFSIPNAYCNLQGEDADRCRSAIRLILTGPLRVIMGIVFYIRPGIKDTRARSLEDFVICRHPGIKEIGEIVRPRYQDFHFEG